MNVAEGSAPSSHIEGRFRYIGTASAEILRSTDYPAVIANPYLHPRNMHPSSLALYMPFIEGREEPRTAPKDVLSGLISMGTAFRNWGAAWHGDTMPDKIDILFVGHFLRLDQADGRQDLYYGSLPLDLERAGLRCATVLINHTGLSWTQISPRWKPGAPPRLLLSQTLSFLDELRNELRLGWARRILRESNDIGQRAAVHASSGQARSALRIGMQVAAVAARTNARVIVTTYEGHAWERLAMSLARRTNPSIRCVGYHHAVLFPHPRAMTVSLGETLDPDYILTAGPVTCDKIKKLLQMPNASVGVLGSVRRGATKFSSTRGSTCLILPEGLASESVPLIAAAAEAARLLPDVTFRIRLHPVVQRERLLAEAPFLRSLPDNVAWSDGVGLEADIADSQWLLYRGTSAVFQGIEGGVRPFYLALPDEPVSIDPLSDLNVWKRTVSSGSELAAAIAERANPATDLADLAKARLYCSAYFAPVSPSTLIAIAKGIPNA